MLNRESFQTAPSGEFSVSTRTHNGASAKNPHILVVDDEPLIAEALADYLIKKEGYTVSLVSNGQEAVDFLTATVNTRTEIDLVLLDMLMPVLSGLDVLGWIRRHPQLKYMRVVLLTAAAGSREKVQALSAGADDYITKPYSARELLARVQTILRTQKLEKQLQRQSQQLAELNRVGQLVAASLETQEVLTIAAEGVDAVFDVQLVVIRMLEGGQLRCRQIGGQAEVGQSLPPMSVEEGFAGFVFSQRQSAILSYPFSEHGFQEGVDVPMDFDVNSGMAAPLIVRGRAVGVICAFNKHDGDFTDVELDIFTSLASSVSEAIENAWLFQRIRLRQQELLENRNTLQALIDGIPHPIYTINDDWELISINKSKHDELDVIPASSEAQTCFRTFYQRESPCEHCAAAATLTQKAEQHWTVNWIGADHLPREWDVSAYAIPSAQASSARAVVLWQDRTDERRLESSLLQAGKLAAIGRLAAGVAHEINNPLTAINANAELIKMTMPKDDERYESVDLIARAGDRATKVVRGLLDFARQEQYMFAATDINDNLQQALDLVKYQLESANVELAKNFDESLPMVVVSREHMKSVWLNLLVNARDAVQVRNKRRLIEIATRLGDHGEYVHVLIRDNGKGMSQAEVMHIFEPFYTTKEPGKGTGLGLATCHRIVEQHGGEITVASSVGEGTAFIVRLPIQSSNSAAITEEIL